MDDNRDLPEPKRLDVATSVIRYNGKILLLKRSNKVGTYRGKWACASGYIEEGETPYDTALKEISEELGLEKDDVDLVKEGDLILAQDGDTLWAIHPFLFETARNEITLDWEHDELKWIDLDELENHSCVPKLKEAIFSVIEG
jgi:8-oxo-dGTP pyrophosphatase MutT (NUDIX family)